MARATTGASELKPLGACADRFAMEAYLSKALWRAGTKLLVGLAVMGALVGVRIVTATPVGVEGDIAELEQLEAELAAGGTGAAADAGAAAPASQGDPGANASGVSGAGADGPDLDRMVRCLGGAGVQYMRAADCATRGGELQELPPPEPEADDAHSKS
jgi:hypothetical protein